MQSNLEPLPYEAPSIGHNMGPPLFPVISWHLHGWRTAQKKAWKTPPLEVVRMRTRRARAMGLDYRSYSLVLMDRGTAPSALVFDLGGALIASADGRTLFDEQGRIVPRPNVVEKLEAIGGCSILVVAGEPDAAAAIEQLALLAGATITGFRTYGPGRRDETIAALASEHAINPSSCVLICERPPETGLLGGFVPTADYFR